MLPVFVGGCPRSGTTLLGSVLGSHQSVVCVPESQFKIPWIGTATENDGFLDRDYVLDSLAKSFRYEIWNLRHEAVADSLPIRADVESVLTALVTEYALRVNREVAQIWVDHTPNNIRYFIRLARAFPRARFIHLVRDPRAVTASLKPLDWGPNHSYTCAMFWSQQISFGLAAEDFLGERLTRIYYEDLVRRPQATVEHLCRFLAIDFRPAMIQAHGFRPPSYSETQHRLVGQKPDPSRITSWERALTGREIELIEATVCDLLAYLGYSAQFGETARAITGLERLCCSIRELLWTEIVNRWRLHKRRRHLS